MQRESKDKKNVDKKNKIEDYLLKGDNYNKKVKDKILDPLEDSFKKLVVELIENSAVDTYRRSIMQNKIQKKREDREKSKERMREEMGEEYISSEGSEESFLSENEKKFLEDGNYYYNLSRKEKKRR